jgi:uncharacterized protein
VFDRNPNQPDRYDPGRQPPPPQGTPYGWGAGAPGTPGTTGNQGLPGAVSVTGAVAREGFLTMSFVWMFLALVLSAVAASVVMTNEAALRFVLGAFWIFIIAELALVVAIGLVINRIGSIPGLALLFVYALLNGATMGIVVLAYTAGPAGVSGVVSAFLGASAIFGGAALYGVVTKRDLTGLGGILFMGLLGLIVVSVVQLLFFPANGAFSFAIGVVGVIIFTVLTAYDVQRINKGGLEWIKTRESASVVGALHLYLDFVNLFLMLLRVFGSSRD